MECFADSGAAGQQYLLMDLWRVDAFVQAFDRNHGLDIVPQRYEELTCKVVAACVVGVAQAKGSEALEASY